MSRIVVILVLWIIPLLGFTQGEKASTYEEEKAAKLDTIYKLGGKKILCTVLKVSPTSVSFTKPAQGQILELHRKEIEKIIYKNGKKEVFNRPVISFINADEWQAVLITYDKAEVEGLFKKGVVKANSASGSRSSKAAKKSAIIRIQKKAANMGALIVYIIKDEMKGGYGEIPGCELEGIAYGDTPPADTAAVNKAVRLLERNKERIANAKKKNN
jgi:hypothetical protein